MLRKPFGQLKHFRKEGAPAGPKLLMVAPMSGHYATLLRGTVERMVPGHDVYITDWRDAKLVPLDQGSFDLDDYIDYLIEFLEHIGPGAHMLAVCQPSVPAYAAAALMSADKNPCRPKTLTMMGGPIDTRMAPTEVNTVATERPFAWFENNVIATVPYLYPGAGRSVYPGFLQLAGFMAMNLGDHLTSHWEMFKHLVQGDGDSADASKDFYDEYRSVCDMTSEFYLQTVDVVFQRHLLPKGELMHRGRRVDPAAIRDIALLAIEGERDDIRRHRPDQGRARHLHRPAGGAEALSSRQGRRPLRHLPRQQMAHPHRAGGRAVDRRARLSAAALSMTGAGPSGLRPFFSSSSSGTREQGQDHHQPEIVDIGDHHRLAVDLSVQHHQRGVGHRRQALGDRPD